MVMPISYLSLILSMKYNLTVSVYQTLAAGKITQELCSWFFGLILAWLVYLYEEDKKEHR